MQFNTERRTAALGSAPRWKRNAMIQEKVQHQAKYNMLGKLLLSCGTMGCQDTFKPETTMTTSNKSGAQNIAKEITKSYKTITSTLTISIFQEGMLSHIAYTAFPLPVEMSTDIPLLNIHFN
jgi:hypothetical protein